MPAQFHAAKAHRGDGSILPGFNLQDPLPVPLAGLAVHCPAVEFVNCDLRFAILFLRIDEVTPGSGNDADLMPAQFHERVLPQCRDDGRKVLRNFHASLATPGTAGLSRIK